MCAADPGNKRQVVVVLPLLLAAAEELAEAAVLDGIGIRVGTVLDGDK